MSVQNGRPGNSVTGTAPISTFMAIKNTGGQHPLTSPRTTQINTAPSAPVAPGAHIPPFRVNGAVPTPLNQAPTFKGTGRF